MTTRTEPHPLDLLAEAVRADPANGRLTLTVSGRNARDLECEAQARGHRLVFDEPVELGGADTGPNPVEAVIASLGACQAITYRVWAHRMGLRLDDVRFELEGDIDLAGFLGLRDDVRPGPGALRQRVTLTGPEREERYRELAETVNAHCPVLDMLAHVEPVTLHVEVQAS